MSTEAVMTDNNQERSRDAETKRFVQEYSFREVFEAVDARGSKVGEVSEIVGCSYNTAYNLLQTLTEDGYVEKREVGGAGLYYPIEEPPEPAPLDGDEEGDG